MTTLALDLQPDATLTLKDAISGLLAYLEPTTLIVPQEREVPIVVLTGIMAPLARESFPTSISTVKWFRETDRLTPATHSTDILTSMEKWYIVVLPNKTKEGVGYVHCGEYRAFRDGRGSMSFRNSNC
jgi:hypothetical protein